MLVLSNASISGSLPTWFQKMPVISVLDLSHNDLEGPLTNLPLGGNILPVDSLNVAEYEYIGLLFLQRNHFNGSIPVSLCSRPSLEQLDISNNGLTGEIPNCLGNMVSLENLDLSNNGLTGEIPTCLGNMVALENLDLSKNALTGKLPLYLFNLPVIGSLKLSSNRLSGVIPSFGRNKILSRLHLNDNNFSGELPGALFLNLPFLIVLDLGNNKLSGSIPESIRHDFGMEPLHVLRLHKNNLTGRIPKSLCKHMCLRILDVAHNSIEGPIPSCFSKFYGMTGDSCPLDEEFKDVVIQVMKGVELEYTTILPLVVNMNLSSNELVGQIPEELTRLHALLGLSLSHNYLNGSIPGNIGNMKSLDFSENKFSGVIPPSLADLKHLSYLNVSYNNLSGPIPTGSQLQTFNDPSIYAGNEYLYGAPLTNNCSNHEDPTTTRSKKTRRGSDEPNKVWFYFDILSGFATGFWGIIGVLLFKKRWRHNLFRFAEDNMDKIYVAIAVSVAKMKRRREVA